MAIVITDRSLCTRMAELDEISHAHMQMHFLNTHIVCLCTCHALQTGVQILSDLVVVLIFFPFPFHGLIYNTFSEKVSSAAEIHVIPIIIFNYRTCLRCIFNIFLDKHIKDVKYPSTLSNTKASKALKENY